MKKISWVTHDDYDIPLPKNHKFTATKFSDLYNELKKTDIYHNAKILKPTKANVDEVSICHDLDYVLKIKNGNLSNKEIRRLGFNWSEKLSKRSFLAVNGTLLTCKEALSNGIANHLAGGTHHSHKNFGSGYCVFNDCSFASLHLLKERIVKKILIFDTDVHQGDGTASILQDNKQVFTCSIHCKNNFPFRKSISDMDVELEDDLQDSEYLAILKKTLDDCLKVFSPDLVIFDTGVDIHKNDELGNLNITTDGLLERDIIVLNYFKNKSIPIATVIGGGYSKDRTELAKRHSLIFKASSIVFS